MDFDFGLFGLISGAVGLVYGGFMLYLIYSDPGMEVKKKKKKKHSKRLIYQ